LRRNGASTVSFIGLTSMESSMKALNLITLFLVIVGGLNWGLVAMDFNLVAALFGPDTMITNAVYVLVGISALWQLVPFVAALGKGEVAAEQNRPSVVR
jgi:uncharacterized protein